MAEDKKKGFQTVEMNPEELKKQNRQKRLRTLRRSVEVLGILTALIIVVQLLYALRSFDSYEIRNSVNRGNSDATSFAEFGDYILEYNNDGIACVTHSRTPVWNQAYEMNAPKVAICGDYLAVYDVGGLDIYIIKKNGLQKYIKTTTPIETVCIAKQGTIAVLMRTDTEAQIKLFNVKGEELVYGKFYAKNGSFPIDIALSHDATNLAVDMVDVDGGAVGSTIAFYNFGAVGQSSIGNSVGSFSYEGVLIPEIDYVSDTKMLAFTTDNVLLFEGRYKPELKREFVFERQVKSFFHNEKYIGVVTESPEHENKWQVQVFDLKGKVVMENDISIPYNKVSFLSNNEICVLNENQCELFTLRSIKKFSYTFEKQIQYIVSAGYGHNYTFIFKETTEEVRLK